MPAKKTKSTRDKSNLPEILQKKKKLSRHETSLKCLQKRLSPHETSLKMPANPGRANWGVSAPPPSFLVREAAPDCPPQKGNLGQTAPVCPPQKGKLGQIAPDCPPGRTIWGDFGLRRAFWGGFCDRPSLPSLTTSGPEQEV